VSAIIGTLETTNLFAFGDAAVTTNANRIRDNNAECLLVSSVSATAFRIKQYQADLTATATVIASPNRLRDTAIALSGAATVVATANVKRSANAGISANATVTAVIGKLNEINLVAFANGTITVTVTTADGAFTDTLDIVITGQVVPVTSITITVENDAVPTIVTAGGTLQLIATILPEDATDADVVWTATPVGIVTVDENGLVTAVTNGTAVITATSANGPVTASINVTVDIPTAIVEGFDKNTFAVYPNPTADVVNIKSVVAVKTVSVYDSLGKEIMKTAANAVINMASFSNGIYILKAEFENGNVQVAKIIKY
jgi:hypothetical protein